jgi:hypothetical protein
MMQLFGLWNEYVLHSDTILGFFARPGCDETCVRKVLSIHSLVGLLFFIQFFFLGGEGNAVNRFGSFQGKGNPEYASGIWIFS